MCTRTGFAEARAAIFATGSATGAHCASPWSQEWHWLEEAAVGVEESRGCTECTSR